MYQGSNDGNTAARLDVFAGRDRWHNADEAASAARLDARHREAGVRVVKGNALDHAGQLLDHLCHCIGSESRQKWRRAAGFMPADLDKPRRSLRC
jgi:hypothetical protein